MSFRRKAPSQIARDYKRVQDFKQRKREEFCNSVHAPKNCDKEEMTVDCMPSYSSQNTFRESVDPIDTISDSEIVNNAVPAAVRNAGDVAEATGGTGTETEHHNAVTVTVSELELGQSAEYLSDRDAHDFVHTEESSHGQSMDYVDSDTDVERGDDQVIGAATSGTGSFSTRAEMGKGRGGEGQKDTEPGNRFVTFRTKRAAPGGMCLGQRGRSPRDSGDGRGGPDRTEESDSYTPLSTSSPSGACTKESLEELRAYLIELKRGNFPDDLRDIMKS